MPLKKKSWILLCCWVFNHLHQSTEWIYNFSRAKISQGHITQSLNPEHCFLLTVMSVSDHSENSSSVCYSVFRDALLQLIFCLSVFCSCRSKDHIMAGSEVIFKLYNPTAKE